MSRYAIHPASRWRRGFVALLGCLALSSCVNKQEQRTETESPVVQAILSDEESFYHINFREYPEMDPSLPIGVFDSGTGGLTVLDALVRFDEHQNSDQQAGQDGQPDFRGETFIYLADQANMPYGNYDGEGKTDLLVEHVIKDAQFLLGDKYYPDQQAQAFSRDKKPVKSIVIACNTATAYAKEHIEAFIEKTGIELKVIGVIDAGARGTLEILEKDEDGSIGVLATVGTVASKGYENTILKQKEELGYTGNVQVFNQGGHGIAEAVDEEPDFIDRDLTDPRDDYRGPSLDHPDYTIDRTLLDVYNFDFDHRKMLCDTEEADDCQVMQLNDPENYVRYHLVSLMEQIRKAPDAPALKTIVLGCTHYPYLTGAFEKVLSELYDYQRDGNHIYRGLMAKDIAIIDPAVNVARELYAYLQEKELFNPSGDLKESEFYISVPNPDNENVQLDEKGRFPYDYKYGRNAGEIQEYVKVVPFSKANIPAETLERLQATIPATFGLITRFHSSSPKTRPLEEEALITGR